MTHFEIFSQGSIVKALRRHAIRVREERRERGCVYQRRQMMLLTGGKKVITARRQ
jgi:hypothetical protein